MKFLLLFVLFFLPAVQFHRSISKPEVFVSRQDSTLNFNRRLTYAHLGLKRMLSSLIWVETVLTADEEKYNEQDLNSWMYLRFDTLFLLDPLFLKAYQFAGPYLSVVKDDVMGAKDIYDRGLQHYPKDYLLIYNAAFHYYHEVRDTNRAIELYRKIVSDKRTPEYLASFISRLMTESDVYDENEAILILVHGYHVASEEMKPIYIDKIKSLGGNPEAFGIQL